MAVETFHLRLRVPHSERLMTVNEAVEFLESSRAFPLEAVHVDSKGKVACRYPAHGLGARCNGSDPKAFVRSLMRDAGDNKPSLLGRRR